MEKLRVLAAKRMVMPRFFIDFDVDGDQHSDVDGFDGPDVASARKQALRMGAELLRQVSKTDRHTITAVVLDEERDGLLRLTLDVLVTRLAPSLDLETSGPSGMACAGDKAALN